MNPLGKVPALRHGQAVVTETAAICACLADRFPEKSLMPPLNHRDRASYFRWLFFAAGPLESAVTAMALGWQVPEGKSGFVGFGSYADTIDALETAQRPGPYICGEQFTAADLYLGAQLGWGLTFGTIEKRSLFEAYVKRMDARPAAQRANRIYEEYLTSARLDRAGMSRDSAARNCVRRGRERRVVGSKARGGGNFSDPAAKGLPSPTLQAPTTGR